MEKFGQDAEVTHLLFSKKHPGIFNDHRESGPRFNVSAERRCLLTVQCPRHYTGVLGPTQTAPPAGRTNTSSNSNLVSSSTDQLNPAYLQWATGLGLQGDIAAGYMN